MTGGTRKRGTTWRYYLDVGKVGGREKKADLKQKRKQKLLLLKQSVSTIMLV